MHHADRHIAHRRRPLSGEPAASPTVPVGNGPAWERGDGGEAAITSLATTLSRPLAILIGALAAARRARAFHPVGTTAHAEVELDAGRHPLARLAGRHRAIVRTSRGVGLPAALPDIHGVAVRLLAPSPTDDAGAAVVDLILASAGTGRFSRHLLRPGRDPLRATYSSLAPYADADGRRFVVGGRFVDGRADRFDLLVARPGRPWQTIGRVATGAVMTVEEDQALRFEPFTCPPWMEPVGAVNELRRPAYRASQAHRPVPAADEEELARA